MSTNTNYSDLRVNEQQGEAFTREEGKNSCMCMVAVGGELVKWGFEEKSADL